VHSRTGWRWPRVRWPWAPDLRCGLVDSGASTAGLGMDMDGSGEAIPVVLLGKSGPFVLRLSVCPFVHVQVLHACPGFNIQTLIKRSRVCIPSRFPKIGFTCFYNVFHPCGYFGQLLCLKKCILQNV
jgi:hypothetical protein